jgi:hypothetical protein
MKVSSYQLLHMDKARNVGSAFAWARCIMGLERVKIGRSWLYVRVMGFRMNQERKIRIKREEVRARFLE